ncbi:MAG: putative formate dehydrogenase [Syntrophaceae bacterium PtaU1.Bin231]|nr:MAG: putative formate dehydrogenase [Syntrophaceae bacterium PtaU1.Bin231]
MSAATFSLNGRTVAFHPGKTILEAARENGIHIPTLCFLKGITPSGACRICVVEVEGARTLVAACSTPVAPDMRVFTDTPRVQAARRLNTELLLSAGRHDCLICEANGNCTLQELAYRYKVDGSSFRKKEDFYPIENINPFVIRDFSRCTLCGRCVQACNQLVVNRAISHGYRGKDSKIIAGADAAYHESDCVFCGQCVEVCPTGALTEKKATGMARVWETKKIRTTCPYCGVGCQMWLHVKEDRIVKVTAVEGAAPNDGRLCVKGRFGYDFIYSDERLTTPLIRENGEFRKASWEESLDLVASRFKEIIARHGADAIAGVSCARSINEDSYQMQKLFRAVLGTNNIDHCART